MKIIDIYDNENIHDRYTIVTNTKWDQGYEGMLSASTTALAGWGGGVNGDHLGKRISINDIDKALAAQILTAVYSKKE